MAVTATFLRNHKADADGSVTIYCTASLSGTYVQGGFTWNPLQVPGGAGSSPIAASTVLDIAFRSPTGYRYATALATSGLTVTATTKIYTSGGTELAAGALPDASVPVVITTNKR